MHLRIDRIPRPGQTQRPNADDLDWCVNLTQSPAVLWRAMEHPLVHETGWYRLHKRDEPAAILSVVRAARCSCGCGIELVAHSVPPTDGERLARGMAEALVDYAMECELNGRPGIDHPRPASDTNTTGTPAATSNPTRRHVRVMIRHDGETAR